jgi:glycosyltransferase involved in cell wall biosynthesis
MPKVKVLYFVDRMRHGGIQTFVLENMSNINKDNIQIDYLLLDDGTNYELENILKNLGANVYKLKGIWIRRLINYYDYYKSLNDFFSKHKDYTAIHLHSSSKNFMVLYCAKKHGIKTRIAHSHSAGFMTKSKLQIILGNILKFPLRKYATHYFACSEIAGKWLFGKKTKFSIIHNAVDVDKFIFNQFIRDKIRNELKLENHLVIGHVGRFIDLKNHNFLIDIFYEIHKRKNDFKLLLIGIGEKEKEIKQKVNALGLSEHVIFLGYKTNVNDYMQCMDIFLLPSKFEGLGLVLIEAQASGLPCFTSKDVVPSEAKVSDLLNFISLDFPASKWADKILNSNLERKDVTEDIKAARYDIKNSAKFLEEFYKNLV